MSKTIKQIADELGVSKTAVLKKIDNLGLRSSLQKNANQFTVCEDIENRIKAAFLPSKSQTKTQTESQTVNQIVCVLQQELAAKNEQLAAKDRQIESLMQQQEKLTAALAAAQQNLGASQALHAGTIKLIGGADPAEPEPQPAQKKPPAEPPRPQPVKVDIVESKPQPKRKSFWHNLLRKGK